MKRRPAICCTLGEHRTPVARRADVAVGLWDRLRGLMGRPDWGEVDGLLIDPCNGVHTFFVRFPIEVVFLDPGGTVVAIDRLSPFRLGRIHPAARRALELPWGTVDRTAVKVGVRLSISELTGPKRPG